VVRSLLLLSWYNRVIFELGATVTQLSRISSQLGNSEEGAVALAAKRYSRWPPNPRPTCKDAAGARSFGGMLAKFTRETGAQQAPLG